MAKLYILCGIPFAGKSTVADLMVRLLGVKRVDLDEVKFDLFGKDVVDEDLKQKDWDKVYQKMYPEIENSLKGGKSVVHDTGNFTKYERGLVRKIGKKVGAETVTIFLDTPYEIAKIRQEKNNVNNTRFIVSDKSFEQAVAEMEIPGKDENTLVYDFDTPPEKWIEENLK